MSQEFATLAIGEETYQLPIIEGTRGDKAIDISTLLKQTGYITLDSGYMNTGACTPSITYLDGAKGVLDYRGYAIEDLAAKCSFMFTVMFALGRLPGRIAQWTEMREDRENARIGRPRQIYSGNTRREFVKMKNR